MARDRRIETPGYRRLARYVLDRDRYVCQINADGCTRRATQVDHIISRADGGDVYDPTNLRASCAHCNGHRAALRTNEMRYRTTLARYDMRM